MRCLYNLIGNPVQIGDEPVAVTLSFSFDEKEPFLALKYVTVPITRDGKAAKKAGKSEDLPESNNADFRGQKSGTGS